MKIIKASEVTLFDRVWNMNGSTIIIKDENKDNLKKL